MIAAADGTCVIDLVPANGLIEYDTTSNQEVTEAAQRVLAVCAKGDGSQEGGNVGSIGEIL